MIYEFADEDAGIHTAQQIRLQDGGCGDQDRFHHRNGCLLCGRLHVLCAHFAGAALANHQTDGSVFQTKVLADLVDQIPLVAEMEQLLRIHKGHERGRAVDA